MGADKVSQKQCQGEGASDEKARSTGINRVLKKTKLCHYLQNGGCPYGDKCAFAHSVSEVQESPDLRKTKLCKAFQKGECNDSTCNYAHGERELRVTGLFVNKTLCVWHQKGSCRNGENCKFAHGTDELCPEEADDATSESTKEPSDMASETTTSSSGRARRRAKRARAKEVAEEFLYSPTGSSGVSSDDDMPFGSPMKIEPLSIKVPPGPPPGLGDFVVPPPPGLELEAADKGKEKEALMQDLDQLTRNSALLAMQVNQIRQKLEKLEEGNDAKPSALVVAPPSKQTATGGKVALQLDDGLCKRTPLNKKAQTFQPTFAPTFSPNVYMDQATLNPYAQEYYPSTYF
mmetsp:Transcript_111259/g.196994  ORF Transcript_111259/g.196994 Transcript_111259/m.196994 type:complete len:347 (-) Transcript_111259:346-1386(-)